MTNKLTTRASRLSIEALGQLGPTCAMVIRFSLLQV